MGSGDPLGPDLPLFESVRRPFHLKQTSSYTLLVYRQLRGLLTQSAGLVVEFTACAVHRSVLTTAEVAGDLGVKAGKRGGLMDGWMDGWGNGR